MKRRILSVRFPLLPVEHFLKQQTTHQTSRETPWWDEAGRAGDGDTKPISSADAPLVLVQKSAKGTCLSAVSLEAMNAGLWVGQKLSDARAIFPDLCAEQHDTESDESLLQAFSQWAMRYSPSVATNGQNGLLIDSFGCDHLFGGEYAMAKDIEVRFAGLGFTTNIGLADSVGAAVALSDYGAEQINILSENSNYTSLYTFPVEALRLEDDTLVLLKRLGLKTIGDVIPLPRMALERRFRKSSHDKKSIIAIRSNPSASASAVQWRIDQLTGAIGEPLDFAIEPDSFWARFNCTQMAQDHEAIRYALGRLLPSLCTQLETAGLGALHFLLTGFRADGGASSVGVYLSVPARDPVMIMRLFKDRLDQIDCGFGIDLIVLHALRIGSIQMAQDTWIEDKNRQAASLSTFADTLTNRLENASIYRIVPHESHVPERAQKRINLNAHKGKDAPTDIHPLSLAPRPTRLFERPELTQVTASLPDGPPAQFIWRRVNRRVVRARGPERILPEWWVDGLKSASTPGKGALVRDYYDVEDTQGMRFWIYRAAYHDLVDVDFKTPIEEIEEPEATGLNIPKMKNPPRPEPVLRKEAVSTLDDQTPTRWRWFVHGIF